jgi:hypothetical protein
MNLRTCGFKATIDDPTRFKRSRSVGASLMGCTPTQDIEEIIQMPVKRRIGHVQRGLQYAVITAPDHIWTTRELMREWTHVLPLYQGKDSWRERNHYCQSIHRAAASAGLVRVGSGAPVVDEVAARAKENIARARRSAVILAFTAGAAALLGAAASWFAACAGGRVRDGEAPPHMLLDWGRPIRRS